jgi:hypothetical protein
MNFLVGSLIHRRLDDNKLKKLFAIVAVTLTALATLKAIYGY